jgi:hypothetical protein
MARGCLLKASAVVRSNAGRVDPEKEFRRSFVSESNLTFWLDLSPTHSRTIKNIPHPIEEFQS